MNFLPPSPMEDCLNPPSMTESPNFGKALFVALPSSRYGHYFVVQYSKRVHQTVIQYPSRVHQDVIFEFFHSRTIDLKEYYRCIRCYTLYKLLKRCKDVKRSPGALIQVQNGIMLTDPDNPKTPHTCFDETVFQTATVSYSSMKYAEEKKAVYQPVWYAKRINSSKSDFFDKKYLNKVANKLVSRTPIVEQDALKPEEADTAGAWKKEDTNEGDGDDQRNSGIMHHKQPSKLQYSEDTIKLYIEAAEHGNARGQFKLGFMYEQGAGVSRSDEEAAKWYAKAAVKGHAVAQAKFGRMYYYGIGVAQSYEEAAKWYRKAAEQESEEGQMNLAVMYEYGQGVPQSYVEAVKWYREAAKQGSAKAQNKLGDMYFWGWGVPYSTEEAMKWYRKAAALGNEDGRSNLEFMQEYGRSTLESDVETFE